MSANVDLNQRPDYDPELQAIADYVLDYRVESREERAPGEFHPALVLTAHAPSAATGQYHAGDLGGRDHRVPKILSPASPSPGTI